MIAILIVFLVRVVDPGLELTAQASQNPGRALRGSPGWDNFP